MIIQENVSLKSFNTFGIDVSARYYVEVQTVGELETLLNAYKSPLILGGGSNILFTKDIDQLVIHNSIKGITKIDENDEHVLLKVGAGENWHDFVLYCLTNDYAGVENLSLIPGSVGATPIQNIGAYGVEIKDVLHSVDFLDFDNGMQSLSNTQCAFGYRDSIFKHALKNKIAITFVTFILNKTPVFHLEYGAIREKLKERPISIQTISDAVIQIRREKLPDPKKIGNAGSFFKNPTLSKTDFLILQEKYPKIPHFFEENDKVKIPAGWLIEQCGFKGKRFGNIGIHEHQALVLVNYGDGLGSEIKMLSQKIQEVVFEHFGIQLQTEVNIL